MARVTIAMTARHPVSIEETEWPIISQVGHEFWQGTPSGPRMRLQLTIRGRKRTVKVNRKESRTEHDIIISATRDTDSAWVGEAEERRPLRFGSMFVVEDYEELSGPVRRACEAMTEASPCHRQAVAWSTIEEMAFQHLPAEII